MARLLELIRVLEVKKALALDLVWFVPLVTETVLGVVSGER